MLIWRLLFAFHIDGIFAVNWAGFEQTAFALLVCILEVLHTLCNLTKTKLSSKFDRTIEELTARGMPSLTTTLGCKLASFFPGGICLLFNARISFTASWIERGRRKWRANVLGSRRSFVSSQQQYERSN